MESVSGNYVPVVDVKMSNSMQNNLRAVLIQ